MSWLLVAIETWWHGSVWMALFRTARFSSAKPEDADESELLNSSSGSLYGLPVRRAPMSDTGPLWSHASAA